MFLYCNSSSSSSTTTITANNSLGSINTENFQILPYSPHIIYGSIPLSGGHPTGSFTLEMRELSLLESLKFNQSGGTIIVDSKTINVTPLISEKLFFKIIVFNLGTTELLEFKWKTVPEYITKNSFPVGEVIDFYPLQWSNAISDGTTISPISGNIIINCFVPTIFYTATFTGTIYLYDQTQLIYSGTTLEYPNPAWRAEIDGTLTSISYYAPSQPPISWESIDLTIENPQSFESSFYKNIVGGPIISINGSNYNTNSIPNIVYANSISGATSAEIEKKMHFEQEIGNFQVNDFSEFSTGSINIENDYFRIFSDDQLNNPAMVNSGIIYSADANALTPFAGSGIININFKQPTYVKTLIFSSSSSITIGMKSYSGTTISPRDFVNKQCFLCNSLQINLSGKLISIEFSAVLPYLEYKYQNYITEDFAVKSVEFPSIIFDTNIAGEYGTPNTLYGGPGIGIGGISNTIYLGNATQSNIVFDEPRYVKTIKLLNCKIGDQLTFLLNAAIISQNYVGNFGQNSVHILTINKKVDTINITGTVAIAEISYSGENRQIVQIPDNSITPISLNTELIGNYIISVIGSASAIIYATKSVQTLSGTIYVQSSTSATDESLNASWSPNESIQIYHMTTKTGGIGDLLYYIAKIK